MKNPLLDRNQTVEKSPAAVLADKENEEISQFEEKTPIVEETVQEKAVEEPAANANKEKRLSSPLMNGPSVRDILLKKAKEYTTQYKKPDKAKSVFPQQQMAMSWPEDSINEDSPAALSPFEKDLNFSDEDLR